MMIYSRGFLVFCFLFITISLIRETSCQSAKVARPQAINNIKKGQLYNSEECHDDIVKYCPRGRLIQLNDINVVQCFYNELKDLSVLDSQCQHVCL